jgi:hypothetical protein
MIDRPFWLNKIAAAWQSRSLIWLSGVRRAGKTTLVKAIPEALYFNCDLPSVQRLMADPESFYSGQKKGILILDEVHQLADPSGFLKIGVDEFPQFKILATGSSTLAATRKFRDSLAGRKQEIHLLPVLLQECPAFGILDLRTRLFHGGLPQALVTTVKDPDFYIEWLNSFYARDIQELFRVDKRHSFLKTIELIFRQSGSLLEITNLAKHAALSRPTVMNYLEILQATHLVHLLRPFYGGSRRELVRQPKMYAFDTGFIAFYRGWMDLREDDLGPLWEHHVLESLRAHYRDRQLFFWRDKEGNEIDFVIDHGRQSVDAVECKWNPEAFDSRALARFREDYPQGRNYLLSPLVSKGYERSRQGLRIFFRGHVEDIIAQG